MFSFLLCWIVIYPGQLLAHSRRRCPCDDEALCRPVSVHYKKEVYGFKLGPGDYWKYFDWDQVTSVLGGSDDAFVCHAHAANTRVISWSWGAGGGRNMEEFDWSSAEQRRSWVQDAVAYVKQHFSDGLTFDYEEPLRKGSRKSRHYTELVAETASTLHQEIPGSQVSVCVGWSPNNIDGRAYDYLGLSKAADTIFVMSYDTRSQIFDRCAASANDALPIFQLGLQQYLDLGIPASKLVAGVPWYGYDYPCLPGTSPTAELCPVRHVSFRGVNCSNAVGTQRSYADIMAMVDGNKTTTGVRWDYYLQSPYFNYVSKEDGLVHQIWYDDVRSLGIKYETARKMGLRGVGPWQFNFTDPLGEVSHNPAAKKEHKAMWDAFHKFTGTTKKHGYHSTHQPHANSKQATQASLQHHGKVGHDTTWGYAVLPPFPILL